MLSGVGVGAQSYFAGTERRPPIAAFRRKMVCLRSIAFTTTAVAASALPAALAFSSLSPSSASSSSSSSSPVLGTKHLSSRTPTPALRPLRPGPAGGFTPPPSSLNMDALASHETPSSQEASASPELLTEFMVDMKCDGCVNAVKSRLQTVPGIKTSEVDLDNQVVRIFGSTPVKAMTDALEQTGRKARLIGQGNPGDFLDSAAVAEFKGPYIFGVVRFAQVSMKLARIEASFSGLSQGKHAWSINEFGDLTKGAASTGNVFNPANGAAEKEPVGDLGTFDADMKGDAFFSGSKPMLKVGDLIGRSVVVFETEGRSDGGVAAAVIARSAGVGENYKKVCTCDGTTIWESTNVDFVGSKV